MSKSAEFERTRADRQRREKQVSRVQLLSHKSNDEAKTRSEMLAFAIMFCVASIITLGLIWL